MNVVHFPGEITRALISRLDRSNEFSLSEYLECLSICIQHSVPMDALIDWWRRSNSRARTDSIEPSFVLFLQGLTFGATSWDEEKGRIIEAHRSYLQEKSKQREPPSEFERLVDDCLAADLEDRKTAASWAAENPAFSASPWIRSYISSFEQLYGHTRHLTCISDAFKAYFPNLAPEDYIPRPTESPSIDDRKLQLLDRPKWVQYGSLEHHHLVEVANWVGRHTCEAVGRILVFLLAPRDDQTNTDSRQIAQDAVMCCHATFRRLMLDELLDGTDADVLLPMLKLPVALKVALNDAAHLTPEFGFLGTVLEGMSGLEYDCPAGLRRELIQAWRLFFKRYRMLRESEHHSRTFASTPVIVQVALASVWGSDECWEHETSIENSCIQRSFAEIEVDLLSMLHYLNERYFPFIELWVSDCATAGNTGASPSKTDMAYVFEFSCILLPIVSEATRLGHYRLANALMGFFITIAGFVAAGNLDSLSTIPPVILPLKRTPGFDLTRDAIRFAVERARESDRPLTVSMLDQFLVDENADLEDILRTGETERCEFKSTLRWNLHSNRPDERIEQSVIKTIAGFANKDGGTLMIGVSDSGQVIGIEKDGFQSQDKWNQHLRNVINRGIPGGMDLVRMTCHMRGERSIVRIDVEPSSEPVYARIKGDTDEAFYVRRGPATEKLVMSEAVRYIRDRFQRIDLPG